MATCVPAPLDEAKRLPAPQQTVQVLGGGGHRRACPAAVVVRGDRQGAHVVVLTGLGIRPDSAAYRRDITATCGTGCSGCGRSSTPTDLLRNDTPPVASGPTIEPCS
jgi:hypothetical protein